MENNYYNLIEQTFEFPQEGFEVVDNKLQFHGIDLMSVIEQYGTPLKLSYLPKISQQIQQAKEFFKLAMSKHSYAGNYTYCYCTKSSHFSYVLTEALKNDIHLETSSGFDIYIVQKLFEQGRISKDTFVVHNGYKRGLYVELISQLINDGFNSLPVFDNLQELDHFKPLVKRECNIGLRIATGEEPQSNYYTARLGIRHREIQDYYMNVLKKEKLFKLKMLHFFIDNGIEDSLYYWNELQKCLKVYCDLKKECPTLDSLNIGADSQSNTHWPMCLTISIWRTKLFGRLRSFVESKAFLFQIYSRSLAATPWQKAVLPSIRLSTRRNRMM
jgi:arginine decarboxylase